MVEDQGVPVRMHALQWVGVLVQMRAIEVPQAVFVVREVGRYPVEDHADAGLMQGVDQVHEVLRRAVAAARCEVAGRLVAPGPVERVLHHREKLDVRETQVPDVLHKHRRHFAVAERPILLFRDPPPGPEMHLVDRDWRVEGAPGAARGHPLSVLPFVVQVPDDGCRLRRSFGQESERVCLVDRVAAVARHNPVLVALPVFGARDRGRPDSGSFGRGQRVRAGIPPVEVPDN